MLAPKEEKNLRKTYKKFFIFLGIAFVFDAFICFLLLSYTKISTVLAGLIIIIITFVLYLLFSLVCVRIEKRKAEKLEKSKKKDPFSHK